MARHQGGGPLILVEAAVETIREAIEAERAGAGRIELCANLQEGGTTPSAGLIAAALDRLSIPVVVMIRPRGGNFIYTDDELDVMRRDVLAARELNVHGLALGIITPGRTIDVARMMEFVELAGEIPLIFHRAFDKTRDAAAALADLVALGVRRVLTSGGAPSAVEGVDTLASLREQGGNRIGILAGGGIREHNVRDVVARSGVNEVHTRFISGDSVRRVVEMAQAEP